MRPEDNDQIFTQEDIDRLLTEPKSSKPLKPGFEQPALGEDSDVVDYESEDVIKRLLQP